jgi:hypothetical protein
MPDTPKSGATVAFAGASGFLIQDTELKTAANDINTYNNNSNAPVSTGRALSPRNLDQEISRLVNEDLTLDDFDVLSSRCLSANPTEHLLGFPARPYELTEGLRPNRCTRPWIWWQVGGGRPQESG